MFESFLFADLISPGQLPLQTHVIHLARQESLLNLQIQREPLPYNMGGPWPLHRAVPRRGQRRKLYQKRDMLKQDGQKYASR